MQAASKKLHNGCSAAFFPQATHEEFFRTELDGLHSAKLSSVDRTVLDYDCQGT